MGHTNPYPLEPPFELRSPGHNSSPSSSPAWPSSTSESSDDETNWFDSPSTVHPFSASTKSTKRPKLYEKKSVTLSTPPDSPISSLHATPQPAPQRGKTESGSKLEAPLISPRTFSMDTESEIWEDVLSHAIDFSDGRVDLRCVFPNSVSQSTSAFLSQAITASRVFHIIYQTLISSWSSKSPMTHHPSLDAVFPVSPLRRRDPVYFRERGLDDPPLLYSSGLIPVYPTMHLPQKSSCIWQGTSLRSCRVNYLLLAA